MESKSLLTKACVVAAFGLFSFNASATTTGLDFAGGCPQAENNVTDLCQQGSGGGALSGKNPDTANVAAILGVSESLVTLVAKVDDGTTSTAFTITGIGSLDGNWVVVDTSITHLAFKSDGYFILGERQSGVTSGTWDNQHWDLTRVDCPATICTGGPRPYTWDDFTTNGDAYANLSNVTAFSVVPVPAAVWLFGSGLLGLIGIARRKHA